MEQLCSSSNNTKTSSTTISHDEVYSLEPLDEVDEPAIENDSKETGVQCCLGYKYVITSTVSTQTEPIIDCPTCSTAPVAEPSPTILSKDQILREHSYSAANCISPVKSAVSPVNSDMSDEESTTLSGDDGDDDFFVPSQDTVSTTDSESEPEPDDSNLLKRHIKEPKYLVFNSSLQKLFKFCFTCGAPVSNVNSVCQGSLLTVKTTCIKHHALTWNSQPMINRAAVGNLLIASSILFTGNTYARIKNFSSCLGLKFINERVFYRHQNRYLFPIVNDAWKTEEASVIEKLANQEEVINLNGDGRCDSPGHNAKYGTYTMMDNESGKVVTFKVVQVTEVTSSNAMEKEGFVHCLDKLENSLDINMITTDRHTSIASAMSKDYSHIKHQFDVWHLSKSVVKKLNKKAKLKKYAELAHWIQSISNHLWWCAATCEGDVTLLREKWKSVVHHVSNKHSWKDAEVFKRCAHPRLSRRQIRTTCWLQPGSAAHVALEEVVLQPKLVNDIAKLTEFSHTGGLEVYHSMLLKYCSKKEHFSYRGMIARTQLAAIDNNHNTGRQQAVVQKGPGRGDARYRMCFPKTHKRWGVKPIKEQKNYDFLPKLQLKVLQACDGGLEGAEIEPLDEVELPANIASVPAPDKDELIQRHRTRFAR